ncbi:urease accessory protein UreF [Crossiella cryophila]|uniref:Urease accessory protein UreF n=1 Tax=Crossiella cryophila TaxID=43355 RepID=A0A7W7CLK3_9PSEU|nr:urease accessory UreF family protein [Crossiella cryophila]MBB4681679.1 urease accessory protein [Crossiella cryophila]
MVAAGLLLLADARLPAGGHVHSGSVEAAVRAGAVTDVASLHGFLRGRLVSAGLVTAAFAAAATRLAGSLDGGDAACWAELDAELDARTPAAGQRIASRQQGRGLLRALPRRAADFGARPDAAAGLGGAEVDAAAVLAALRAGCPAGAHHPLAFGAGAAILGASAEDAAVAIALAAVTGPASAAIRLLAFDPFAVQSVLNSLSSTVDSVAATAAIPLPWSELPDEGAPALDVLADTHPTLTDTLFVS